MVLSPTKCIGCIGHKQILMEKHIFLFVRKIPLKLDDRAERRSDGVHRIHWTRIDSDGKVHFLFVRDLE